MAVDPSQYASAGQPQGQAAPQSDDGYSPDNPGPVDPSMPVPPIPPASNGVADYAPAGPAVPMRADGVAGLVNQPGTGVPASGLPTDTGNRQAPLPAQDAQSPVWMALLKAGGAMMSSKQHTALGGIGEGVTAAADSLTQSQALAQKTALANRQVDALSTYRNGMVANGAGRVANGAEGNAIKTVGQVQRQPLIDATVEQKQAAAQASLARAAAAGNSGQAAFNAAVQDLISQGMLPADAYAMAKNYTPRNDQTQQRLEQGNQRLQQQQANFNTKLNADQTYRAQRAQLQTNEAEDHNARSMMFAASQSGKNLSYSDAINQVRGTRSNLGNAPSVGAPAPTNAPGQGVMGLRAAATSTSSPVRVNTPQEAQNLPPGTAFMGPDGIVRVRTGGQ